MFAHGKTITLVSTTTTDNGLGDTTTVKTEIPWGPCAVAPRYAIESTDRRVTPLVVGKTVYGPTVAIDSDDTLVIDGVEYEIDGLPGEWTNPFTGWDAGMEVPIKRVGSPAT